MNIYFLEKEKQIKVLVFKPMSELIEVYEKFNLELHSILFCSGMKYYKTNTTLFTIENASVGQIPKIFEWFHFNCQ